MSSDTPYSIDFRVPQNFDELAVFIGIDKIYLEKAISPNKATLRPTRQAPPSRFDVDGQSIDAKMIDLPPLFISFGIPKRGFRGLPQYRKVWAISDKYVADAYKSFNRRFDLFVRAIEKRYPHDTAYGFVRGRNIVDNATGHCQAKKILHADIKNFFPSITIGRIKKLFLDFGLQPEVARILSEFVTVEGGLAQGLCPRERTQLSHQ